MEKTTAYLSNKGKYTIFTYDNKSIRFLTSKNLEKYISVLKWDNGYIEVMSKNFDKEPEENYIDLIPILENLLIDPVEFLKPIKEVEIDNA